MNPTYMKSVYANLLEHFHLTLEEIGNLTDRQIQELYFHKRTPEGVIQPVENHSEGSYEEDLKNLDHIREMMGGPKGHMKNYDELVQKLKEKYFGKSD